MSQIPEAVAYPVWFLVAVGLLNAFKSYLPFLSEVRGVKDCKKRCEKLQKEVDRLKEDYTKLKAEYDSVHKDYLMLFASIKMIKSKLKSMGYENIPGLDTDHEGKIG